MCHPWLWGLDAAVDPAVGVGGLCSHQAGGGARADTGGLAGRCGWEVPIMLILESPLGIWGDGTEAVMGL